MNVNTLNGNRFANLTTAFMETNKYIKGEWI